MGIDESIKNLRIKTGMNRKAFAEYFEIPLRTVEDWEAGRRKPPEYIPRLLDYRIRIEFEKIVDLTANIEIDDKRNVNVVSDTDDEIYIGNDLPDEYTGSKYTYTLKGTNAKAKANVS